VLAAIRVSKRFNTPAGPIPVLDEVSFALDRGDAASIMGPSGSGKSTLLYILGGLEPPTSGEVTLDGQDPYRLREPELAAFRNRKVGFVFQDHCLLPQCSVLENVLAPTLVADPGGRTAAKTLDWARWLIDEVGLTARAGHRPAALSGGEKQRAAIARALVREPLLLLCDEPTGNLDRRTAESVGSLLVALHERLRNILIVVTHSPDLGGRFRRRYELVDRTLAPVRQLQT
jgi:lipoprotein-releasing system ATP-binding protein